MRKSQDVDVRALETSNSSNYTFEVIGGTPEDVF